MCWNRAPFFQGSCLFDPARSSTVLPFFIQSIPKKWIQEPARHSKDLKTNDVLYKPYNVPGGTKQVKNESENV
jgi:hypothetical protein